MTDEDWNKHLTKLRENWVGKESGDFVCKDVIKAWNERHQHFYPILDCECKICGKHRNFTVHDFLTRGGTHKHMCINIDTIKAKLIGKCIGDYECIDAFKDRDKSGRLRNFVKIKCKVCENIKNQEYKDFLRYKNYHGVSCTELDDRSKHVGETFGDFTVLKHISDKPYYYITKCNVCGKIHKDVCHVFLNRKHQTHEYICSFGIGTIRFRKIWISMNARCYDKNHDNYFRYGGRGIKIQFKDYIDFYNKMFKSYKALADEIGEENVSIERVNVDGDYSEENCYWIHIKDQSVNRNTTVCFKATDPFGRVYYAKNLFKFCQDHNLNRSSMNLVTKHRLNSHHGWHCECISVSEFEEYWRNHASVELDWLFDILYRLHMCPEKKRMKIPLGLVIREYCNGFICEEVIDALCNSPNKYNMNISYDKHSRAFIIQ